MKSSQALPM